MQRTICGADSVTPRLSKIKIKEPIKHPQFE